MKLRICLAKTTVIFYSFLTPLIILASLHNLIYGVILNENSVVYIGAFSLFGFIILPLLLLNTYRQNKCVIQTDKVSIGKSDFPTSSYCFEVREKHLSLKDRPIFSLLRKTYYLLVAQEKATGKVVLEKDLEVFKGDIKKIKTALLQDN